MKIQIKLTASEVLTAVAFWMKKQKPEVCGPYTHIKPTDWNINSNSYGFELYVEEGHKTFAQSSAEEKEIFNAQPKNEEQEKSKRLLRVEGEEEK